MDNFQLEKLPRLIDISCVKADITKKELDEMVTLAKKHRFVCCFAMPCFTPWLVDQLKEDDDISVGGVIGFPSGADSTSIKKAQTKEHIVTGCNELDMVINIGALKSKMYDTVKNDIKTIVATANGLPVKCILEVAYLTDYEIQKGSEIAVESGVSFVKTGTGWAPNKTTTRHINLIKSTIGNSAKIKAAGGVGDLNTILEMLDAGCQRFGIGVKSSIKVLNEINEITKQQNNL